MADAASEEFWERALNDTPGVDREGVARIPLAGPPDRIGGRYAHHLPPGSTAGDPG